MSRLRSRSTPAAPRITRPAVPGTTEAGARAPRSTAPRTRGGSPGGAWRSTTRWVRPRAARRPPRISGSVLWGSFLELNRPGFTYGLRDRLCTLTAGSSVKSVPDPPRPFDHRPRACFNAPVARPLTQTGFDLERLSPLPSTAGLRAVGRQGSPSRPCRPGHAVQGDGAVPPPPGGFGQWPKARRTVGLTPQRRRYL
jgi:hypothetical protein